MMNEASDEVREKGRIVRIGRIVSPVFGLRLFL
jgi:hypothetical protein